VLFVSDELKLATEYYWTSVFINFSLGPLSLTQAMASSLQALSRYTVAITLSYHGQAQGIRRAQS